MVESDASGVRLHRAVNDPLSKPTVAIRAGQAAGLHVIDGARPPSPLPGAAPAPARARGLAEVDPRVARAINDHVLASIETMVERPDIR